MFQRRTTESPKLGPNCVEGLKRLGVEADNVYEPIRIEDDKFAVFILKKDMWATWQTAPKFPVPPDAETILSRATLIQSTPANFPVEKDHLAFRRLAGTAIVQALNGDATGASATLDQAEKYVNARAAETSRFWYVQASLVFTMLFLAFGVLSERLPWGWPTGDGKGEHLGMAAAFGALGALFSFLSRLRSLNVDPASGRKAHYADAFVRILLGVLGAFIFAVGINANFVLGFVSAEENVWWLMYVFCTAAGYSERLVPDFLQQVESSSLEKPE